jgi:light-regulated signal transduction histidine kinase (bacteriophytochrome)
MTQEGFAQRYARILSEYASNGDEGILSQAYELAREAITQGRGLLDLAEVHRLAIEQPAIMAMDQLRVVAVLTECLGAFEMTHRGYREANLTLQGLNRELLRSNSELSVFAHAVGHDLQQPLYTIDLYTQLLGRRFQGKLDPKADELISRMSVTAKHMSEMLAGLLSFARSGGGGEPITRVDIESVFDQVLLDLAVTVSEKNARVTHGSLPTIYTRRLHLTQILQNLISNALKFTPGTPPIVHVSAERGARDWTISVADNGIGIDPADRDRIFKVFERVKSEHDYPGVGIGLAVCRQVVEGEGGRIWFDSRVGAGSTFHFTLPVQHDETPGPRGW